MLLVQSMLKLSERTLTAFADIKDAALIDTGWLTTTLEPTVITASLAIVQLINATFCAAMVTLDAAATAAPPIAYRTPAAAALDVSVTLALPMAYRKPAHCTADADATEAAPRATLCAPTDAEDAAAMDKAPKRTTWADAAAEEVDAAAAWPMQTRFAATDAVLDAVIATAASMALCE